MVYLCWAKVAANVEERLEKADRLVRFMEQCVTDGFVWMIVVDHLHILCRDPDLENQHLVLCIIDYGDSITDPEKNVDVESRMDRAYMLFLDAMMDGANFSDGESDCDIDDVEFWPAQFALVLENTQLHNLIAENKHPGKKPWHIATGGFDPIPVPGRENRVKWICVKYALQECPQCHLKEYFDDIFSGSGICEFCKIPMFFRRDSHATGEAFTFLRRASRALSLIELPLSSATGSSDPMANAIGGLDPMGSSSRILPVALARQIFDEGAIMVIHPQNAEIYYCQSNGYFCMSFDTVSWGSSTALNVDGHITLIRLTQKKTNDGFGERIVGAMREKLKSVIKNVQKHCISGKRSDPLKMLTAHVFIMPETERRQDYAMLFIKHQGGGLYDLCHQIVAAGIAPFASFSAYERFQHYHCSFRLRPGASGPVIVDRIPVFAANSLYRVFKRR